MVGFAGVLCLQKQFYKRRPMRLLNGRTATPSVTQKLSGKCLIEKKKKKDSPHGKAVERQQTNNGRKGGGRPPVTTLSASPDLHVQKEYRFSEKQKEIGQSNDFHQWTR